MKAPLADLIKSGVPPTALKARTGEFTPPELIVLHAQIIILMIWSDDYS